MARPEQTEDTLRVKPAPGRAVRDPRTLTLLPDEGRDVPDDVFWSRRLRDEDVVADDQRAGPPAARKEA